MSQGISHQEKEELLRLRAFKSALVRAAWNSIMGRDTNGGDFVEDLTSSPP